MRKLLLILPLLFTACTSTEDKVASLFDRLEFKEGQEGCIRATGQVSIGGNPFANSSINVTLVKKQGENPEDC